MKYKITEVYFKIPGLKVGYEVQVRAFNLWVPISHPLNCHKTPLKAVEFYNWWAQ